MRVKITLTAALTLLVVAVALTLTHSPERVIGTDGHRKTFATLTKASDNSGTVYKHDIRFCQPRETVPAGTTKIRLSMYSNLGPRVSVQVLSGKRILAHGSKGPGWSTQFVEVPVDRVASTVTQATICVTLGPGQGFVGILGQRTSRQASAISKGVPLGGALRIDYLAKAQGSWWSRASSVVHRIGLGRAWGGLWITYLLVQLTIGSAALTAWLIVRELARVESSASEGTSASTRAQARQANPTRASRWRSPPSSARRRAQARAPASPTELLRAALRRVPVAAWTCALIALMNGVSWSILTPAFQAPYETDHFAYVQKLVETGHLPGDQSQTTYSTEENTVLTVLNTGAIFRHPNLRVSATAADQLKLKRALADRTLSKVGSGGAGAATPQPPLYYALQAVPYDLASQGTLLQRMQLMRLLSALLGAVTALFTFLFLREALPRERWAWTVGGLGVALAPLLGFMSGLVQPDVLLYATSAALFYCFARAFRRGLTLQLGATIGALIAIGYLTKLNFLGLLPGAVLGVTLLTVSAARSGPNPWLSKRAALQTAGLTAAVAGIPILLYILGCALASRSGVGPISSALHLTTHGAGSLLGDVNYIWQLYLPRLPGMNSDFPGMLPTRAIWFNSYVGLYGVLDTVFSDTVETVALVPAALIALLLARTLIMQRAALWARRAELLVYGTLAAGLMALVGGASYVFFLQHEGAYGEPRLMMPLAALLAAALALAARGAGRRWGPVAGTLIVVLFLAHDIFSQLLVVARYYG